MTHRESEASLATITIGQAPRPDLRAGIDEILPAGVSTWDVGVLDGLSRAEVEARFGARPGRPVLVTRLLDGEPVAVDAGAIEAGLQVVVDRMADAGVPVVAVLCTGEFPSVSAQASWLVEPDRLVVSSVRNLVGDKRLGVVVPMEEQVAEARRKWAELDVEPCFAHASPYVAEESEVVRAVESLVDHGARAVVLDCMAFGVRHREAARRAGVDVPVLVSGNVFAHAIAPLLT